MSSRIRHLLRCNLIGQNVTTMVQEWREERERERKRERERGREGGRERIERKRERGGGRERWIPLLLCGGSPEECGSSEVVDPREGRESSLAVEGCSSDQVHLWRTDWCYHTGRVAGAHIRICRQSREGGREGEYCVSMRYSCF